MNRFSKFAASALALSLVPAMLMGCGKKEASTGSDLDYIKQKGTLVVGITDFAPMDYQDADGSWIGFDADLAKAFAESLGVEVQFQTIEWDNKVMELDGKTIDVVWNGMTLTDEVTSSMACSNAYCNNAQVVILPADKAANYGTVDSLSGLRFAVESGSAGMAQAEEKGLTYTDVVDQATALLEVKSGTADAAIIDSLMAGAMVGEGTNYADLAIGPVLNAETGEQYGVGFRKGSDAAAALNEFFRQQWESGALQALAEQSRIVRLPLNQVGSLNKINKAFARFEQEHERTPSPEELANELDIPKEKVTDTLRVSGRHVSVDAPFADGEDNSLLDVLVNNDSPIADRGLINESLSTEVDRALSTLTDRERDIIKYFFGIGCSEMTLEEIGEKFGLTRERVRQIKEKAIRRLRHSTRSKLLKSYLG